MILDDHEEPLLQQQQTHFIRFLNADEMEDKKSYEKPRVKEVALLYTQYDQTLTNRGIRVYVREKEGSVQTMQSRRIVYTNPHLDPMCFPLLFINGELGWRLG